MFRALTPAALVAVLLAACGPASAEAGDEPVRYDGWRVIEVVLNTPEDLAKMLSVSQAFLASEPALGTQPWVVAPEKLEELARSGLVHRVVHEDFQELLDREQSWLRVRGDGWYENYATYEQINDRIDTIVAQRPDLATKFYIGDSIEGRAVYGLTITSAVGVDKPALLFNGTQHAREWISPMTVMYIADELVAGYDTDAEIRALLDEVVFYIIPVVNPDGYIYSWDSDRMWRKNRRYNGGGKWGVDPNRNWATGWGGPGSSGSPGSSTYRGTAPFSEPETANLRDFILAHDDIVAHIDFHSHAQLILYPFGYDEILPPEPDLTLYEQLSAGLKASIFDVHGATYIAQTAHALYLAGGIMTDWVYDQAQIYSWTIELRPDSADFYGFVLPPDGIILTGEENFEAIKFLAQFLTQPLVIRFPDGRPTLVPEDQATTVAVTIAESGGEFDPNSPRLLWRIGASGPFTATALTPLGANDYEATLPAAPCGTQLQYYFQAETTEQVVVNSPLHAPSTFHVADVGITIYFEDDMESDQGWTVGAPDDDATNGIWNRMDPEGTEYRRKQVQPEDDHSDNGTSCWVTDGRAGSSAYSYNVDDGKTTLTSPMLDLDGSEDPVLSYWRWYHNNAVLHQPDDAFQVDISNDGGASWVNVETSGPEGVLTDGLWYHREFRIADFVTPTAQVKIRVVVSDDGESSLVECALDEVCVFEAGCSGPACPGDLNADGVIDLQDLAQLLGNYGTTSGATYEMGDLDGDADVDLTDLATLLAVYGTTCP